MKIKTDFYYDRLYWDTVDEMLNNNDNYDLLCENHGTMIAVCVNRLFDPPQHFRVYVQVGFWTLEYDIQ